METLAVRSRTIKPLATGALFIGIFLTCFAIIDWIVRHSQVHPSHWREAMTNDSRPQVPLSVESIPRGGRESSVWVLMFLFIALANTVGIAVNGAAWLEVLPLQLYLAGIFVGLAVSRGQTSIYSTVINSTVGGVSAALLFLVPATIYVALVPPRGPTLIDVEMMFLVSVICLFWAAVVAAIIGLVWSLSSSFFCRCLQESTGQRTNSDVNQSTNPDRVIQATEQPKPWQFGFRGLTIRVVELCVLLGLYVKRDMPTVDAAFFIGSLWVGAQLGYTISRDTLGAPFGLFVAVVLWMATTAP